MKKRSVFTYAIPAFLFLATLGLVLFGFALIPGEVESKDEAVSYRYRVGLVSDASSSAYLQEIYEGARQAGKENGVLVELIGEYLPETVSLEDAMRMAIYGGVDGILLRPNGTEELRELIQTAENSGIPVITVEKDVPASARRGFVGSDDFYLGQQYGKRVKDLSGGGEARVMVLLPQSSFDARSRKYFRQGLLSVVTEGEVHYYFRTIRNDGGLNNSEQIVQDIVLGKEKKPDIIVCLDEDTTKSVCRLLEDRGQTVELQVIGGSLTGEIAEEILAGRLDSTITMDYQAMGRSSLQTLMDYWTHHMVSYYTEAGSRLITDTEAREFLKRAENENTDQ